MATNLLNDDGTASMATALMCSHHAFRRDLASFARALGEARCDALAEEWARFRATLHGHHMAEDAGVFPELRRTHPELAKTIDQLDAHHRAIDPLLERGDQVFADLAHRRGEARELIETLAALLAEHLDVEEGAVIPHLRGANQFPPLASDDAVAMYADGFAWSSAGISEAVLDLVFAMLPAALVAHIPAARRAFDERSRRVWGYVHAGASVTSVPVRR